jgi:hypothetical protein
LIARRIAQLIININGKSFRLKDKRKAGLMPNFSKRPTKNHRAARNGRINSWR